MDKEYLEVLKSRFYENMHRHENITWDLVLSKLDSSKLKIIKWMEETRGMPDVTILDLKLAYVDFAKESPNRRSLCYDDEALNQRKHNKPISSVISVVKNMNVNLLTKDDYLKIQELEPLDLKTSSWLFTPKEIRSLGGSIFGDRRYNQVFIYHNGSDSYYSTRGFRAKLYI